MNKSELLKLRKKWYATLKETGFNDIEHISESRFLDDHVYDAMARGFRNLQDNYSGYYDAVRKYLDASIASTRMARINAMLMGQGLSQREISRLTRRAGTTEYGVHMELVRMMRRAQKYYKEVYIPAQVKEEDEDVKNAKDA